MIVAVITVRTMQPLVDEVVHVVAVWDRRVLTSRAVLVAGLGVLYRVACRGMRVVDRDGVLVDVIAVRVVQMPVVNVIGVPVVNDGEVPASGAVLMVVIGMHGMVCAHR